MFSMSCVMENPIPRFVSENFLLASGARSVAPEEVRGEDHQVAECLLEAALGGLLPVRE